MKSLVLRLLMAIVWLAAVAALLWAAGALAYDLPWPRLRVPAAVAFLGLLGVLIFKVRGQLEKICIIIASVSAVAGWWMTLRPSHHRHWQPEVDRLARATIKGEAVTIHNVRNFAYRSASDFTPKWETRTYHLGNLTGADIALNYWGSPWMAHPILSFQFSDAPPLCFSIETRKEVGETYSAIGGLYRRFELIYVVADERDVLRVRTSIRQGEDVYLYRMTLTPQEARKRLLEYLDALNSIHEQPKWYNAVTTNCTTAIRTQTPMSSRLPWDWRLLVNGKGDQMMYERGQLVTCGLPFAELKRQAHVNPAAAAAGVTSEHFSKIIRSHRPGFTPQP